MANLIRKQIAGISFVAETNDSIILEQPSSYNEWMDERIGTATGDIEVKIHIEFEDFPDVEVSSKIFDSGQSWSMYRDGDAHWVVLNPPTFLEPFWVARMNHDVTEVTVYCGKNAVNDVDGRISVPHPVRYPLDQILLMYILAQTGGVLVHAAGVDIKGKGCIFAGRSGAGKSTLMRQFDTRKHIGLLSDDRVAIRKIDGVLKAFGTPWPGDAQIAGNKSAPLAGVFFIYHGSKNEIKELNPKQALRRLLPVASVPWYDGETCPKVLSFCEDLIKQVPAYEFHFEPTVEAIDVLEKFVSTEAA